MSNRQGAGESPAGVHLHAGDVPAHILGMGRRDPMPLLPKEILINQEQEKDE